MKFWFLLVLTAIVTGAGAQKDSIAPAYKRFPEVPAIQLFLADSITKYTKADLPEKKALLIMLFNPDCDHCQYEAEQIVANKEKFNNIHILMATTYPIYRMKEFALRYGLDKMQNVVMAKDPYYILPSFYAIRSLPLLAMYNKKGRLLDTFEGSLGIDKILEIFKKQ